MYHAGLMNDNWTGQVMNRPVAPSNPFAALRKAVREGIL
jgi:hypothetical protein